MRQGRRSGWATTIAAITSAGIMARANYYCIPSVGRVHQLGVARPRTSPTAMAVAATATATTAVRAPSAVNTLFSGRFSVEPQSRASRGHSSAVPAALNALSSGGVGDGIGGDIYDTTINTINSRGADRACPWPLAVKRPKASLCRGVSNRPFGRQPQRQRNAGLRRSLASSSTAAGGGANADEHGDDGTLAGMPGGRQVAEPGVVYFVATPIGNLEDITLRAMNILRTADIIAAEDTRTAGSLLKLLGVERTARFVSHHDHNTRRRVPEIVDAAREGKSVAVVSDAGTPGISDPGMELAEACAAEGVRVVPVPGACAAVAAVSVSGFESHEFVFFGFVSGKRGSAVRRRKLEEIAREPRTCVMYESPHRIADTLRGLLLADSSMTAATAAVVTSAGVGLNQREGGEEEEAGGRGEEEEEEEEEEGRRAGGALMGEEREERGRGEGGEGRGREGPMAAADVDVDAASGRRPIVLARELTKLHEEIFRGTLKEATDRYGQQGAAGGAGPKDPRGEFTVVLGPREAKEGRDCGTEGTAATAAALETRLMELTAGGMSTSSAVKMASKDLNLKKSDVYRVALALTLPSSSKGAAGPAV